MADPHCDAPPSAWVNRFAHLVAKGSDVLDVAAGAGRHCRLFLERGYRMVAVDRDTSQLTGLPAQEGLEIVTADLESGGAWPLGDRRFAGVVVTNYLYRPILPAIIAAVGARGALIYETFALGNERFGKPSNPDFLLRPGELLDAVRGQLRVVAYEDLEVTEPRPAAVQRIAAVR
jgi:hypothetical protein